ncbi:MAG: transglutaminase domain-containing protein [Eubacterium sp.]
MAFHTGLYWAVKRFKQRKLKTLDGYTAYLKKWDLSKVPPLSVGKTDDLKDADYNNLFSYLEKYDIIKEKYSLDNVIKGDNDFEKALSLMQWLTDSTYYSGAQCLFHKLLPDDTLAILDFSYKKSFKYAINCRYKAIALTDLLIAYGIKAYPVAMIDANKDGNHLTVQIYLSDDRKWVLFDPSFNTYFTDNENNVLDVFELRDYFLEGKEPIVHGYNFNGTTECIDIYKKVFIKSDLTNLRTWHDNSNSGRKERNFDKRKAFDCKLPDSKYIILE